MRIKPWFKKFLKSALKDHRQHTKEPLKKIVNHNQEQDTNRVLCVAEILNYNLSPDLDLSDLLTEGSHCHWCRLLVSLSYQCRHCCLWKLSDLTTAEVTARNDNLAASFQLRAAVCVWLHWQHMSTLGVIHTRKSCIWHILLLLGNNSKTGKQRFPI